MDSNGYAQYIGYTSHKPEITQRSQQECEAEQRMDRRVWGETERAASLENYELARLNTAVLHKTPVVFPKDCELYLVELTIKYIKL